VLSQGQYGFVHTQNARKMNGRCVGRVSWIAERGEKERHDARASQGILMVSSVGSGWKMTVARFVRLMVSSAGFDLTTARAKAISRSRGHFAAAAPSLIDICMAPVDVVVVAHSFVYMCGRQPF
jgi:hypothetical protein